MPEAVTAVFKKDLESRPATDEEQTLINERVGKGEPAYDEDRKGFKPKEEEKTDEQKADELKAEAKELGLEEDATEEQITTKKQENADTKAEDLKQRAVALDLPEDSTEEDIVAKETEKKGGDDDPQKAFDEADETGKSDLAIELELNIDKEEDDDKKTEMQKTLDKWNEVIENPETEKKKELTQDEEIEVYAKDKEVSEEDAREVIEARDTVMKKHGKDPKKLAHALSSLQGEYSKEKNAHLDTAKALEQAKLNVVMSSKITPEEVLVKPDGTKFTKEEVIERYRESYSGQTDGKEDDEVYDLVRQNLLRLLHQRDKDADATTKADAKVKRSELMTDLSKDAEPYKDSIKKMLDSFPDSAIVQKGFNLEEVILVHKGKDTDKLVKEAEKRGYKRGLERKRILGEIRPPSGSSKTNKDVKGDQKNFGLNDEDQSAALKFFKDNPIPDQRKYELYADMLKKEEGLNKK